MVQHNDFRDLFQPTWRPHDTITFWRVQAAGGAIGGAIVLISFPALISAGSLGYWDTTLIYFLFPVSAKLFGITFGIHNTGYNPEWQSLPNPPLNYQLGFAEIFQKMIWFEYRLLKFTSTGKWIFSIMSLYSRKRKKKKVFCSALWFYLKNIYGNVRPSC